MNSTTSPSRRIALAATPESWLQVSTFLEETFAELEIPPRQAMQLTMAAEEIYVNITRYAYPNGNAGMAEIILEQLPDSASPQLHLIFEDSGIAHDPLSHTDPDTTASAEERSIGGLGIFMAKKLSDRIEYHRQDGKNRLEIWKKC